MQAIGTFAILPDVDHSPGDYFLTARADPSVVEGRPFPPRIGLLERDEFLVQRNVPVFCARPHRYKGIAPPSRGGC